MDEELRDRRELSPAVVGLLIVEKDVVQQLLAKVQVLVTNCSILLTVIKDCCLRLAQHTCWCPCLTKRKQKNELVAKPGASTALQVDGGLVNRDKHSSAHRRRSHRCSKKYVKHMKTLTSFSTSRFCVI